MPIIDNSLKAPEWHIKWFQTHYANWLSLCESSNKIVYFYGTTIEQDFLHYLKDLGYTDTFLIRPVYEDPYIRVRISSKEYTMEQLRTCE